MVIPAYIDFKEHKKLLLCHGSPPVSAEVFYYFKNKPQKTSAAPSVLYDYQTQRLLRYSVHKLTGLLVK